MLLLFIFIDCVPRVRNHWGLFGLMPEDKWYILLQFALINLNETGESRFAHVCSLIFPKQAAQSKHSPSCSVGLRGNDRTWSDEALSGCGRTQNLCCVCALRRVPSPTSRECSHYQSESEQRRLGRMLSVQACRKPLHSTDCNDLRAGWSPGEAVDATHWECQMRELNIRLKLRTSFNWRIYKRLEVKSPEQSVGKDLSLQCTNRVAYCIQFIQCFLCLTIL